MKKVKKVKAQLELPFESDGREARAARVYDLRQRGWSFIDIAEQLQLPVAIAGKIYSKTYQERHGHAPSRVWIRSLHGAAGQTREMLETQRQAKEARAARVYDLRQQGWTLEDIGTQFGVTRERARQVYVTAYQKRPGAIAAAGQTRTAANNKEERK